MNRSKRESGERMLSQHRHPGSNVLEHSEKSWQAPTPPVTLALFRAAPCDYSRTLFPDLSQLSWHLT